MADESAGRTTMVRTQLSYANGNSGRRSVSSQGVQTAVTVSMSPVNPLERMATIVRDNEELFRLADMYTTRLARAREYADDPGSNPVLSSTLVEHARTRLVDVMARLRLNRREALLLLRSTEPVGMARAAN